MQKLVAALALPSDAERIDGVHAVLDAVTAKKRAQLAAATLLHAGDGGIARRYLAVVADAGEGPLADADAIARACAKLDRDRKRMAVVFARTWQRAADLEAVDAAYENLSRELLDDPDLLAAGAEAALRLGDRAAAVERTGRLERAKRLAPRLVKLGADNARDLPAEDRRHVYARVLAAPRAHDPEVVIAAIVELSDDAAVPDLSLSSAIGELADREALVARWRQRVAAGASGLITRLLALFEWSALAANSVDELLPYIRALHPAAGRSDVFAQVDDALASERGVVREAALRGWLGDADGMSRFDDAQADKLTRSAIAIADTDPSEARRGSRAGDHDDAPSDRDEARRVLATASHAGAVFALVDAIVRPRSRRDDALRTQLYRGVARLQHPTVVPFLIDRMFGERETPAALIDALATRLDGALHRGVLGALARRDREADSLHAAALYVELLAGKRATRLVIELARAVAMRQPRTNDDGRRLRYVLEHGVIAALAMRSIMLLDDARAFLARARELPERPYSDLRAADTPSPLAGAADQVAALESGELDLAVAHDRDELAAARAIGKPVIVDDARLAELAGIGIAMRLLDDRTRGVVWFFDALGELHVYDGYAVVPPAFVVSGDRESGIADMGAFAAGRPTGDGGLPRLAALAARVPVVDERVTFFDDAHRRARELIRLGDRILVLDGSAADPGPIELRAIGIKLPGYVAARDVVARFAANPPPGLARVDSWSAVRREYAVPVGTARIAVVGSSIEGAIPETLPPIERDHADQPAAIRALHAWEGRLFAAGGWLARIWIDTRSLRSA